MSLRTKSDCKLSEVSNLVTWICNGCSVGGIMSDGVWFVLVMAIISALLVLLISYATLASQRRRLKWQQSFY